MSPLPNDGMSESGPGNSRVPYFLCPCAPMTSRQGAPPTPSYHSSASLQTLSRCPHRRLLLLLLMSMMLMLWPSLNFEGGFHCLLCSQKKLVCRSSMTMRRLRLKAWQKTRSWFGVSQAATLQGTRCSVGECNQIRRHIRIKIIGRAIWRGWCSVMQ